MEAHNLELRVTRLEERVDRRETLQKGVNATLLQILKEQDEFKAEVRQRFEQVDQRPRVIEQHLGVTDHRLERLEQGQQKIEEILIAIVNKLS